MRRGYACDGFLRALLACYPVSVFDPSSYDFDFYETASAWTETLSRFHGNEDSELLSCLVAAYQHANYTAAEGVLRPALRSSILQVIEEILDFEADMLTGRYGVDVAKALAHLREHHPLPTE